MNSINHPIYKYNFRVNFWKIGKSPLIYSCIARTDLEAMRKYCLSPTIQDISMDEIESVIITHTKIGELA